MTMRKQLAGLAVAALLVGLPFVVGACGDAVSATESFNAVGVANTGLAGTWQFNKELSECPDPSQLREQDQERQHLHQGMGSGHPGAHRGAGGPVGRLGHAEGGPGHGPGPMGPCFADESVQLTIEVADGSVTFTHNDRQSRTLTTDGSETTQGRGSVSAAWVDGSLVITHAGPMGTAAVTHTVSADGTRLTVVHAMDPAGNEAHGSHEVTLVWDRVTG
jgi:hypothetical protein